MILSLKIVEQNPKSNPRIHQLLCTISKYYDNRNRRREVFTGEHIGENLVKVVRDVVAAINPVFLTGALRPLSALYLSFHRTELNSSSENSTQSDSLPGVQHGSDPCLNSIINPNVRYHIDPICIYNVEHETQHCVTL